MCYNFKRKPFFGKFQGPNCAERKNRDLSFTSVPFLIFFAVFFAAYAVCPLKYRGYLLFAGSLFFCIWNSLFCAAAVVSFALVNYLIGYFIRGAKNIAGRRALLWSGLALNLGALVTFKLLKTLPLGISFYAFTCCSYVIDVYRGVCQAELNPARFGAYVTMFPKLQMGPITRYGELSQTLVAPKISLPAIQEGLRDFIVGFCMKIFLADRLAILWNELLTIGYASISTPLAWVGIFSFSIQLYLEWQSYSRMAMGIGRMLGFKLPRNFAYPYLAKSVSDFYRRWHITLTGWFRDYVYIPLGGNRKGLGRTILNILIVWFLTSVWHGIGFNFLLWGMSLGILIALEKLFLGKWLEKIPVLPHFYVLFFIMLTWCGFKIGSISDLGIYFSRLFALPGSGINVASGDCVRVLRRFWLYLLGSVLFCTPVPENLIRAIHKNWIVSLILSVLFVCAIHTMIRQGSNMMMYLNF